MEAEMGIDKLKGGEKKQREKEEILWYQRRSAEAKTDGVNKSGLICKSGKLGNKGE
jgi:hypothetical protein